MSEPRRFLRDGGELERSLLRSARGDKPSPGARQRALAALGLGVGAGVLGAGATTAAASTATPMVKAAASIGVLKWIGVGIASGALVVGAAEVAHSVSPPPSKVTAAALEEHNRAGNTAPPQVTKTAAQAPVDPAEEPAAALIEAPRVVPAAAPEAASAGAPRPRSASPSPAAPALTDEIAALDSAREALASGDAARCLRALDARDRAFPRGALGPEAMVLRIEALALRGDRAAATRLGESFLAASPRSPHASRIRSLLGIAAPAPPSP